MSKRDRGFLLREAATEIENLDFSHKGLSETATSISKDLSDEEIESEILDLAWHILPGTVSPATEAVIKLLVEEAFRVEQFPPILST